MSNTGGRHRAGTRRGEGAGWGLRVLLLAGALLFPAAAVAQVGHAPERSPYRDILKRNSFTVLYGNLGGDGGRLGVGAHGGPTLGLRFDRRLSGFVQAALGLHRASLERGLVNPDDSVSRRFGGPVDQSVIQAELGLQFNLTGPKTWRRLAPYFGGAAGFSFAEGTPRDTTAYEFGNKFTVTPYVGVRAYLSQAVQLRVELRRPFWKLKYPSTWTNAPTEEPTADPVIDDSKLDEWVSGWWWQVGVAWSF